MLSFAKGYDTAYLTNEVGGGREGYYTGAVAAGEPAGLWYGAGAAALGLSGEVSAELMEAIYHAHLDPRDPAAHDRATWGQAAMLGEPNRNYRSTAAIYTDLLKANPGADPVRRAELMTEAERTTRQNIEFYDYTFSAQKSVSLAGASFERMAQEARAAGRLDEAAAWAVMHKAVEDAVLAGARASVDVLQDLGGYSRIGHHDGVTGQWIDAHSMVVAQFLQHDSRDRDPQLHVHNGILSRVLCADGEWRKLDSTVTYAQKDAAGAVGERVMEAHLARALGMRFELRPDGVAREVVGVGEVLRELFSSRRGNIGPETNRLAAAFTDRYGREPSPLERWHLAQQATLETRAGKSHDGETQDARLDRWASEAQQAAAGGLTRLAHTVVAHARDEHEPEMFSPRDVVERAVAELELTHSTWTRSDVMAAVGKALPANPGVTPEQVVPLLDSLTDEALKSAPRITPEPDTEGLPAEAFLENGQSAMARPNVAKFSSERSLVTDHVLRKAASGTGAAAMTREQADELLARYAASNKKLGADQAAALRGITTSGAKVETVHAAAGTGKSFLLGAIADAWTQAGMGRVFGLATAENAARVLADEGVTARNVAAWLAAQKRLAGGYPEAGDAPLTLRAGDIVAVDEASMISRGRIAEVQAITDAMNAKLLLLYDQHQLGAIGPGGTAADIGAHGRQYELTEVRRFDQEWERAASLKLRAGDTSVLAEYARHGRIVDAGTPEQAEAAAARAWLADTLEGHESLLIVPTNEAANRTNARLRDDLIRMGKVEEHGTFLGKIGGHNAVSVGDLVQGRRCGWDLVGFEGNTQAPITRETYRVTGVREDGGLTVASILDRTVDGESLAEPMHLSREYVTTALSHAYASTVHAAEGRTVWSGHGVAGPGVNAEGMYVQASRGTHSNTLWTATKAVAREAEPGEANTANTRSAVAVLADILEAAKPDVTALAQMEQAVAEERSTRKQGEQAIDVAQRATVGRTSGMLDQLAAEGVLTPWDRERLAADQTSWSLDRMLRRAELAGHDPTTVLRNAVTERDLATAESPSQALYSRIANSLDGQLDPKVASYTDLLPKNIDHTYLEWGQRRAEAADDRRRELGELAAEECPQWAVQTLGPPPDDPIARAEWEHKAGWGASYRELTGREDLGDALGSAPSSNVPELHSLWRAAHSAMDLPGVTPVEQEASAGLLRIWVHAWERERLWAPIYAADKLAAATQAAQRAQDDAAIWRARAENTTDPTEAATLRAEADKATAQVESLTQRVTELTLADDIQVRYYTATAATRDAAQRARVELGIRGVDLTDPAERTSTQEWLDAHATSDGEEDPHRVVTDELELSDTGWEQIRAEADRLAEDSARHLTETAVPDIRDTAGADAGEYTDTDERGTVPSADQSAAAVDRARDALTELNTRREHDQSREAHEHIRWELDDRATEQRDRDDELVSEC
ncbi:MAG: TrwC relaxase [Pseudonocardiales bacterium]|nr:MAG: TrwC relaxase [Pseudonocardiales bacterium]